VKRLWTSRELRYLREHYKEGCPAGVAALISTALNRTVASVRSRAKLLGLQTRKLFTPEEIEYVKAHAHESSLAVCRKLGRDHHAVLNLRWRLGIGRKHADFGPRFVTFIREKAYQGWTATEMAKEWRCDRHAVSRRCKLLGISLERWSPRQISRVRKKTREQCRKAGVSSLAAVRVKAFKDYARRYGLPEDLLPREVQIINFLCRNGPSTRRQIAAGVGFPWKGSRKSLTGNRPEGTYLMHLINRGFVVNLGRVVKGKGSGYSTCLYSVPLTFERKFDGQQAAQEG